MLLEGGIKYYEPIRTRQYRQSIGDKVKNFFMPSNLRWLIDGLAGNDYLHTEKDLRQKDILNLQKAYMLSKAKDNGLIDDLINDLNSIGVKTISNDNDKIEYDDYDRRRGWLFGLGSYPAELPFEQKSLRKIIDDSIKSPGFRMASTIGKAKYGTDKNGNVYVYDTYQFNPEYKADNYRNGIMSFIRNNIATKARPYPVEINLGNPKHWDIDWEKGF